jgi:hypothetical protein
VPAAGSTAAAVVAIGTRQARAAEPQVEPAFASSTTAACHCLPPDRLAPRRSDSTAYNLGRFRCSALAAGL